MAARQARGPVDYDHNKYAALLHAKPIDPISTYDVLTVLQSRWNATPETAKRNRGNSGRSEGSGA